MPETQKIHPDSDYANSTVPTGALLIFLGYDTGVAGGNVVQRCKDSSGSFRTLSGAGGGHFYTGPNPPEPTLGNNGDYYWCVNQSGMYEKQYNMWRLWYIVNHSWVQLAQTTAAPSGDTVTVQAVTLGTDGAATASGDPVSAFYTWDLLTTGGN